MTYNLQHGTLVHKALALANEAIEQFGTNDEALDTYQRNAEIDSYGDVTWTAPAWLSYYSSTGTGCSWQDVLIERCEQMQADEYARQYPDRASLFDIASNDESPLQSDAHEWLDAALQDEAIYLSFEIHITDSAVEIRAGFGDEINRPLALQYESSLTHEEFLLMSDSDSAALINAIETAVYTAKESHNA